MLSQARRRALYERMYVKNGRYFKAKPTPKQYDFIITNDDATEAFYGGAAGGGKSIALLMGALMYADVPGYSALILRRTYSDLALPGALMDRAMQWLSGTDAQWNGTDKRWTFPSGATLSFGYLDSMGAEYRYQSSEFQYIAFDELTQFDERQYTYLFSRLRRLKTAEVPIRMRAASNPGDKGHNWVKGRFITPTQDELAKASRVFVPASLDDNPHLDRTSYTHALERLDYVRQRQLRHGDWDVSVQGNLFRRDWFDPVDAVPHIGVRAVRFWDLAATAPKPGRDADWTVGLKLVAWNNLLYVADVRRERCNPGEVEAMVKHTAAIDGQGCAVRMEQEGGSSGKVVAHHYAQVLSGYDYRPVPVTGSKVERARLAASAAFNRRIKVKTAGWTEEFLSECEAFPEGGHDDQVDALSGAMAYFEEGITDGGSRFMAGYTQGRPR